LTTPLKIYFRHRNKKHVAVHCDDTYFHLNGDITENHFSKEKTNLCLKEPFGNLEKEGTGKHTQLPAGAVLKTIRYIAYTGIGASIVHDTQIRICNDPEKLVEKLVEKQEEHTLLEIRFEIPVPDEDASGPRRLDNSPGITVDSNDEKPVGSTGVTSKSCQTKKTGFVSRKTTPKDDASPTNRRRILDALIDRFQRVRDFQACNEI